MSENQQTAHPLDPGFLRRPDERGAAPRSSKEEMEAALEADSMERFLHRAVDFANETLWGNLTATLVAHPTSLDDAQTASALDRAVENLRYGMVLINQYAALASSA